MHFVKRCWRKFCNLEGLTVGVLHLELALEYELVANDPADVHLLGHKDQAIGHFRGHLRVVLLVLQLWIKVLLLHVELAGVDGLAGLAVMSLYMNEFFLLGDGLCRLFVQAGLLLGIHLLNEQAAREFLRLFR